MQSASTVLLPWIPFYTLIGAAAASLTGLMFVVITLVSTVRGGRTPEGISTFSTPTVVHYASALIISAMLCAPWPTFGTPAVIVGLLGPIGMVYAVVLAVRAHRLDTYEPDVEDWTWYTVLPFLAYLLILVSAIMLVVRPAAAPYVCAFGTLLLEVIGIHNAWDIVTYLAIARQRDEEA